jgi:Domain of unknown function (DUF4190)
VSNPDEPGSQDPTQPTDPWQQPGQAPPPPPPYGAPPPPPPYGQQYPPPPPYGQQYPPQYGQPQYPPQYGQPPYGGYPVSTGTNGFAIASLVCAFLCSPLGLIFGLVAKSQIKNKGQGGGGLATAGIILSAVFLVLSIILGATGHFTFTTSNSGP